jgi:predicted N-formylglutamate amidohydrolase
MALCRLQALTIPPVIWNDARKNDKGIMTAILGPGEQHPAIIVNDSGTSPFVLICEHASNTIPVSLDSLGLPDGDRQRHIAWDIGAEGVSRALSKLLDAPLIMQRYSRLVYDCNRPPEAEGAIPEKSEIFTIPGNQNLSAAQRLDRTREIYRPFVNAIADLLDRRAAAKIRAIPVSIHSFTKNYNGKDRSVELGLLFDRYANLANHLVRCFPQFETRLNEPYGPKDGVMHLMNLIASPRGLAHIMIEVRNDLIDTERSQMEWGHWLSVPLQQAATQII